MKPRFCASFSGAFYEVQFEIRLDGGQYILNEQQIRTPPESIFRALGEDEWQWCCPSLSEARALLKQRQEELADWDKFLRKRADSLLQQTWQSSEEIFAGRLEQQREQELNYRGQHLAVDLPEQLKLDPLREDYLLRIESLGSLLLVKKAQIGGVQYILYQAQNLEEVYCTGRSNDEEQLSAEQVAREYRRSLLD